MWKILNHIGKNSYEINEPNDDDFYHHFNELSSPQYEDYFHAEYEANAIEFIKKYEQGTKTNCDNPIIQEIMNSNFTYEEIVSAIDFLKCNKSPGIDDISAEFIKGCKNTLADCVLIALNFIIESQDFPQTWASELHSAVYKGGKRTLVVKLSGYYNPTNNWENFWNCGVQKIFVHRRSLQWNWQVQWRIFEGQSHLWQYVHFERSDRETAGTWPVFICMLCWFFQGIWYHKSKHIIL